MARRIKIDGAVRHDEPMAAHTSFRIGGPADLYIVPATTEELVIALEACRKEEIPLFLLGGGTNILVSDKGIRGAVIDTAALNGIETEGTLVTAQCGAQMSRVAELALSRSLGGLEFAYGLPGSVGGAVWMNARCYDREASDVLELTEFLDTEGGIHSEQIDRADWGYKHSPFQGNGRLILRAGFRLSRGDPREIEPAMRAHREDRERKGHFLFPCAGSVFKNNRQFGEPTGRIVDSLGLKGHAVGGAQIAPFHGNIIINTGAATAADVLALIECVEREALARRGFRLEREVLLVGDWGTGR